MLPALILVPICAGLLVLLLPKRLRLPEIVSFIAAAATLVLGFLCASHQGCLFDLPRPSSPVGAISWLHVRLMADTLSGCIALFCSLFGFVVVLHSLRFMEGHARLKEFYAYVLWTIGAANGAVVSDSLLCFLFFWGVLAAMLYLLVGIDGPDAQKAATKSFVIVGGADFLTLLGMAMMFHVAGKSTFSEIAAQPLTAGGLGCVAFVLILIGALAKAGAMPLHTWVPAAAATSPYSVMALLPASLDKLLGIYILIRISVYLFEMNFALGLALMIIGAVTIVGAAIVAMVQKDLRKLLSFHAVSQAGYMVLGIGTATPIGVAGGLLHMFNDTLYMCCLFLCGANVEHRTKTRHLDQLGGLARCMPVTFIACLVGALAISGVPPLNGFYSKWMIYQGTIAAAKWAPYQMAIQGATGAGVATSNPAWPIFLVAAMCGSALILASFIKVLYSLFLGDKPERLAEPQEVGISMKIPVIILAVLCVLFGVFASVPLKWVCLSLPNMPDAHPMGSWMPGLATCLLLLSVLVGAIVYWLANREWVEEADVFVGGEEIDMEDARVPGTHFYSPTRDLGFMQFIFERAERGTLDIYVLLKSAGTLFVQFFRKAHTGILTTYLLWIALGMMVLLFSLVGTTQ